METASIYTPGQVIGGRYRITSALSQGGMGAVYLAQQVSLGRDVALKVMLERGADPELTKRFDVEARAVCLLKHPNIITYHDYGRDDDGHPFLVMEFLAGYPGTKLVYGDKKAALRDLVHVVAQMCSALYEAHQKGIVHRDLKWSNIMICPQSHDPFFAKLIDFGIMKVATDGSSGDQRQLTVTGMLLGTPEYMSPEAICGMPIDGRADQYSLAVMLWEALEGARPFQGATQFELLRQQVQEEPPAFAAARASIADYPLLEGVVRMAMEKHPDDRFQTILEFRDALLGAVGLGAARGTNPAVPATTPRRRTGQVETKRVSQPVPKSQRMAVAEPAQLDTAHRTARERLPDVPTATRSRLLMVVAAIVLAGAGAAIAVLIVVAGKDDRTGQTAEPAIAAASTSTPDASTPAEDTMQAAVVTLAPTTVASLEPIAPDTVASTPETTPVADTVVAITDTELPDTSSPADTVVAVADVEAVADAAAKPVAEGTLRINADGAYEISIAGKSYGWTPVTVKVKSGTVGIRYRNQYMNQPKTYSVKVKPNETLSVQLPTFQQP